MKKMLAVIAACLAQAAAAQETPSGYTCCNLHYDNDKISDANWTHARMIPAGAPIKVLAWGNNEATAEIDGKVYRIVNEYGKAQQSVQALVGKLVVPKNPRPKIAGWSPNVRAAVEAGKVVNGMTREQVLVAVSYPPTHKTPSLESPMWQHWQSRAGRFEVYFDANGKVDRINGLKEAPPKP
jgi:hypothetical protein